MDIFFLKSSFFHCWVSGIQKITLFVVFFGIFSPAGFSAGEMLDIRIHKNDLSGDIWLSEEEKIQVSITQNGEPLGLGKGSALLGLEATKGALKKKETRTCSFSLQNPAGTTPLQKEFSYDVFEQLASGIFLVPPERIASERFVIDGASDPVACPPEGTTVSSEEYTTFLARWEELRRENPFFNHPDTLRVFPLGGSIFIQIQQDASGNIRIFKKRAAGGYEEGILPSFSCKKESSGTEIVGICEVSLSLSFGEKKVANLVLVPLIDELLNRPDPPPLVPGSDAELSESVTLLGNILIRTTSLLDWALHINESGLHNEQIGDIFRIFLGIANGFFVLALLAIALLWNFSVLFPRDALKKMMALFAIATISVNLALPFTRVLVDASSILQDTFLTRKADSALEAEQKIAAGAPLSPDLEEALQNRSPITASDILSAYDLDYGGFVGIQRSAYEEKGFPQNLGAKVDPDDLHSLEDKYIDRLRERTLVNLVLVGVTAFLQFALAFVFLFRHIILWFLLIFSPFLFVLFLFSATRWMFRYWVYLYSRWLLIGPLLAMCLFITISIWTTAGIPIESAYAPPASLSFPNTTNLYLSAPGVTSGYLNTPREVMKYIAALIMLTICLLLPFWLTRVLPGGKTGESSSLLLAKMRASLRPLGEKGNPSPPPSIPVAPPPVHENPLKISPEIKTEFSENPLEIIRRFGEPEQKNEAVKGEIEIRTEEKNQEKESKTLVSESKIISQETEKISDHFEEKERSSEMRSLLMEKETNNTKEEKTAISKSEEYFSEKKEDMLSAQSSEKHTDLSKTASWSSNLEKSSEGKISEKNSEKEKGATLRELNKVSAHQSSSEQKTLNPETVSKKTNREIAHRLDDIRQESSPVNARERQILEAEIKKRAENGDREAQKTIESSWSKTLEKSNISIEAATEIQESNTSLVNTEKDSVVSESSDLEFLMQHKDQEETIGTPPEKEENIFWDQSREKGNHHENILHMTEEIVSPPSFTEITSLLPASHESADTRITPPEEEASALWPPKTETSHSEEDSLETAEKSSTKSSLDEEGQVQFEQPSEEPSPKTENDFLEQMFSKTEEAEEPFEQKNGEPEEWEEEWDVLRKKEENTQASPAEEKSSQSPGSPSTSTEEENGQSRNT